ncbi:Extracellular metalloproteinase NpI [Rhizoctonia solani AG-1 IB]|uniref:Extracellular metalloproteinase n=1 Tax=Thanatephorus cucumeris (strain AG1-IB / isolate 7/3/14) TaxID=1108050 RepID=M5CE17_THACB|nr:Extracellular metalloproteinase NpI [Rhizoctonia solani AG-1 IB]
MVLITRFAILAFLIAQGMLAAPWKEPRRWTTHSVRSIGPPGFQFKSYHPKPIFESYGVDGIVHSLAKRDISGTNEEAAKAFLEEKLGIEAQELSHKSGHSSTNVANEYFKQIINNITVANAFANVALKGQKVVSFGASFVKPKRVAAVTPELTEEDAISKAEDAIGGKYNTLPTSVEYFAKDSGDVVLTRVVQVQNDDTDEWYEVFVDANSGNNAHVYKSSVAEGLTGQNSAPDVYEYTFDPSKEPSGNKDAASVNVFYLANMMHDLLYHYGFIESSYNFQYYNYGKGGSGNDPVYISVQDGGKTNFNNANFVTPPDGANGMMRLYLWNKTTPFRDGAFENDVVIHEYTHGLTSRMTGGGTARCLSTDESRSLGEVQSAAQDFAMGQYVYLKSFRDYPYSTSLTTNPLTYGSLQTRTEVHAAGEVWANIWHEIYAAFVAKSGFSTDKKNDSSTAGNVVALHLLIDALAIQPCNPTFISARDAIIQADANRYGSAKKCTLWNAFAKRGLGFGATMTKVDSKTLPSGC